MKASVIHVGLFAKMHFLGWLVPHSVRNFFILLHVAGLIGSSETAHNYESKKHDQTSAAASDDLEEKHKYKYWRAKLAEDHRKEENCY
ncbi:hypothetical protein KP509_27G055600 [Ceratopteris richardii]|uniref:Uncharacterized protein n=1 Tax=Ceratopteris richardii TaxID=49495 RepID=A0A8T2RGG8_CERRI|nr:hypothetical protein KP509_27G055600 [Ceratopteris richardii]